MTGATVGVFVLPAVVGPLLRYGLVRSGHDDREQMHREQAERTARREIDTDEWCRDRRQSDNDGNGWK